MKRHKKEASEELMVETVFFRVGIVFALIAASVEVLYSIFPQVFALFRFPCVLHEITGIYCPGCGGTRAVSALLKGNIIGSLLYNPIVLYFAVFYVWFMLSQALCRLTKGRVRGLKYRHIYLVLAFVILILNCIVRNILLIRFGIQI